MPELILLHVHDHCDDKGSLISVESNQDLPFTVKRVYFIYGVPNEDIVRAGHAHKKNHEALIAVHGECLVILHRNGAPVAEYLLHKPNQCLLVEAGEWITVQKFSKDCVLMVMASEHYDPEDYIYSRKLE